MLLLFLEKLIAFGIFFRYIKIIFIRLFIFEFYVQICTCVNPFLQYFSAWSFFAKPKLVEFIYKIILNFIIKLRKFKSWFFLLLKRKSWEIIHFMNKYFGYDSESAYKRLTNEEKSYISSFSLPYKIFLANGRG